jgi:trehalose 6-phosphate phosphatase
VTDPVEREGGRPDEASCVGPDPEVPQRWALFLDIDGTLLHIAETPHGVHVDADLFELVRRLHEAAGGALALISGRSIAEIDRLFSPLTLPAAGQHGLERRDAAGARHLHPLPRGRLDLARERMAALQSANRGLLVEDKGLSFAIHFRRAPALAALVGRAAEELLALLGEGWRTQPGKMVVEIKPAGRDKGSAIAEFMAEPPFRGRTPVFVGDDATDEFGFAVVNRLGGVSVKVGDGESAARWRLDGVAGVRRWLERCVAAEPPPGDGGGGQT